MKLPAPKSFETALEATDKLNMLLGKIPSKELTPEQINGLFCVTHETGHLLSVTLKKRSVERFTTYHRERDTSGNIVLTEQLTPYPDPKAPAVRIFQGFSDGICTSVTTREKQTTQITYPNSEIIKIRAVKAIDELELHEVFEDWIRGHPNQLQQAIFKIHPDTLLRVSVQKADTETAKFLGIKKPYFSNPEEIIANPFQGRMAGQTAPFFLQVYPNHFLLSKKIPYYVNHDFLGAHLNSTSIGGIDLVTDTDAVAMIEDLQASWDQKLGYLRPTFPVYQSPALFSLHTNERLTAPYNLDQGDAFVV